MGKALVYIPNESDCAAAVALAKQLTGQANGGDAIRQRYPDLSVVHTVNVLALKAMSLILVFQECSKEPPIDRRIQIQRIHQRINICIAIQATGIIR